MKLLLEFIIGLIAGFVFVALVFGLENLIYKSPLADSYKDVNKTPFTKYGGWQILGITVGIGVVALLRRFHFYKNIQNYTSSGSVLPFAIGFILSAALTGYFRNQIGLTKH
ncbi:MAG TPA: hypothetical protein VJJ24_02360 [Candidatus Paceibacterota bacterium]